LKVRFEQYDLICDHITENRRGLEVPQAGNDLLITLTGSLLVDAGKREMRRKGFALRRKAKRRYRFFDFFAHALYRFDRLHSHPDYAGLFEPTRKSAHAANGDGGLLQGFCQAIQMLTDGGKAGCFYIPKEFKGQVDVFWLYRAKTGVAVREPMALGEQAKLLMNLAGERNGDEGTNIGLHLWFSFYPGFLRGKRRDMAYLPILPKSWYKNDTLLCS